MHSLLFKLEERLEVLLVVQGKWQVGLLRGEGGGPHCSTLFELHELDPAACGVSL